jgi:LysM repeat protein
LEARSEIENWLQSLSQDTIVDPVYNKAICGNSSLEEWENCDDGENNGKNWYCSFDCLYQNEVSPLSSSSINNSWIGTKDKSPVLWWLQNITHFVNQSVSTLKRVLGTSTNKIWQSIKKAQNDVVNIVQSNVSPETFNTIKQIAAAAKEVSKYTVIWATSLLWTTAAALNVMVYRAHWSSYTIQPGDTIESLWNQFTMTERSMLKKNSLQKWSFKPGQKIKVRNRHFLEKDYLDQLKFVLKDTLEKRNLGRMSAKIDQLFARK